VTEYTSMAYALNEKHEAVPIEISQVGEILEKSDRVVGRTEIGEALVSTVFLVIDHAYALRGVAEHPMLFEMMIFGGTFDGEIYRCQTWDEAVELHKHWVKKVLEADGVEEEGPSRVWFEVDPLLVIIEENENAD